MPRSDMTKEQLATELQTARKRLAEHERQERLHVRVQEELRRSEERFRSLVDSTDDSIYVVDRCGSYLFMNRKHLARLGLASDEELNGRCYRDFHSAAESADFLSRIHAVFENGRSISHEYRAERDKKFFIRTLSPIRDATGTVIAVTAISKDITDRKRMEEELRSLSLTDELTGLHNRRGFFTIVEQELRIANRLGKDAVLFLVDMDELKVINDTHGHPAGDQAIRDTADIIRRSFRESDVIARIGGDEFVIFMIEHTVVEPSLLSRRLQDVLRIYNSQATRSYTLGLTIGWSRYGQHAPATIEDLMRQADHSMYEQKRTRDQSRDSA